MKKIAAVGVAVYIAQAVIGASIGFGTAWSTPEGQAALQVLKRLLTWGHY